MEKCGSSYRYLFSLPLRNSSTTTRHRFSIDIMSFRMVLRELIALVKYLLSRKSSSTLETSVNNDFPICTVLNVCHYCKGRTNSFTFTSSTFAICNSISKLGCVVFVTHLEMVAWSLPSCSASHLLVFSFSAKATLIRLRCLLSILY